MQIYIYSKPKWNDLHLEFNRKIRRIKKRRANATIYKYSIQMQARSMAIYKQCPGNFQFFV